MKCLRNHALQNRIARDHVPMAALAIVEMMERRALLSATGSISGTMFNDLNGDGVHQSNEPRLAGWGVYLDQNDNGKFDAGDIRVFSDSNGNYKFPNLPAKTYYVRQNTPAGWQHTNKTPFPYVIHLAAGQNVTNENILNQQLGVATLVDGTLYVIGTNGADNIYVGVSIDLDAAENPVVSADVTLNGSEQTFAAGVTAVFISALAGNDQVNLGIGNDGTPPIAVSVPATVLGGSGNDQLSAYLGAGDGDPASEPRVYMDGGDGNDYVDAYGDGSTTLHGGAGDDNLYADGYETTTTVMYGDAGNDNLDADLDADQATLYGGDGNDHFSVFGGADQYVTIFGGAGTDTFDVAPNDELPNANGAILALDGHSHPGTNIVLGSDMENIVGDWADDRLEIIGNAANNYISVAAEATILGGAGNDTLVSGGYENWLYGGDGNDLLIPDGDINHLSGGAGTDAVDYSKRTGNLKIYLDGSKPSTDSANPSEVDTFDGTIERVYGGSGNDLIVGNNADDALFGNGGNDTLIAGTGQTALWGGDGNDLLIADNGTTDYVNGGAGDDTAYVNKSDTVVDVEHIHISAPPPMVLPTPLPA
jgi:Ca2+-binding RTX toxin-like protein